MERELASLRRMPVFPRLEPHRALTLPALQLLWACHAGPVHPTLTTADSMALRALDQAYVEAWLADDTVAVLRTLAPDAVMMPAGARPLTTPDAIRDFWWPSDGSHTRITQYTTTIDEMAGGPFLAYMRGTGRLTFTYVKDTLRLHQTTRTMTLTLLTRAPDGRWRIRSRMWAPIAP
jgi:ketosteroid isomerase-like protein